jgi:predicted Zn-dependent protease
MAEGKPAIRFEHVMPTTVTYQRLPAQDGDEALHVRLSDSPSVFGIVLLVWCSMGWLLMLASAASRSLQHGSTPRLDLVLAAVVIGGGLAVLTVLSWAARGRPETVILAHGELVLRRDGVPAAIRRLPAFTIHAVCVVPPRRHSLVTIEAVRRFWAGGLGRIHLQVEGRTYAFGAGLHDGDAERLASAVTAGIALAQPGASFARSSRRRDRASALLAGAVLAFMLMNLVSLPARVLATDGVSCFGVVPGEPRSPVDVRSLAPEGRVLLVPLDDFPPEHADTLAWWFRERFGTVIDVAPPLETPSEAFNEGRGQLNAVEIVSLLEQTYQPAGDREIVIALTGWDMYIPHRSWRYAFSYRGREGFAVVSSQRMDHGCLGMVTAPEEVQFARLRKMVAKNVGVLYYRLPLSRDTRSLMYADVGGPQELDVMSENY